MQNDARPEELRGGATGPMGQRVVAAQRGMDEAHRRRCQPLMARWRHLPGREVAEVTADLTGFGAGAEWAIQLGKRDFLAAEIMEMHGRDAPGALVRPCRGWNGSAG